MATDTYEKGQDILRGTCADPVEEYYEHGSQGLQKRRAREVTGMGHRGSCTEAD